MSIKPSSTLLLASSPPPSSSSLPKQGSRKSICNKSTISPGSQIVKGSKPFQGQAPLTSGMTTGRVKTPPINEGMETLFFPEYACTFARRVAATLFLAFLTISPLWAEDEGLLPRLGALEEENRGLRGQIEELQHELSTLSKRMETLQSDIEYRLSTSPEGGIERMDVPPAGSSAPPPPSAGGPLPLLPQTPPSPLSSEKKGLPDRGATVEEEYEKARALLEQGDYGQAEQAFASFVEAHPQHDLAGAAQYWLGVTYFVRDQQEKAAAAFAKGYKIYPKSSKAVDNLLKLAKSLAALGRTGDACTTLDQLSAEHPQVQAQEVASERKRLGCK